MLDNLTQRLAKVVKTMRGEARLTESNTAEMLREVRLALLEADVALPAVREFIARVREKALGEDIPVAAQLPLFRSLAELLRGLETCLAQRLGEEAPLLLPLCRRLDEQINRASQGQSGMPSAPAKK